MAGGMIASRLPPPSATKLEASSAGRLRKA